MERALVLLLAAATLAGAESPPLGFGPQATQQLQAEPSDTQISLSSGGQQLLAFGSVALDRQQLAPSGGGAVESPQTKSKLDYIIDFMRANKLTIFCDLLSPASATLLGRSQQPADGAAELQRIRSFKLNLTRHLNELDQFTLFIPTDETLLLTKVAQDAAAAAAKLDDSLELTRLFLMAHATGDLVVPRLPRAQSHRHSAAPADPENSIIIDNWNKFYATTKPSTGRPIERPHSQLFYSLAGDRLYATSAPIEQEPPAATRLELIVNGANTLAGQSYALQEPNNNTKTYAVVHLLDRPLWPVAQLSLRDKIRQAAPKFARLLDFAQDPELDRLLSSQLATLLLPTDESFSSITNSRMLEQFESNRTFVVQFLRAHMIPDELYYAIQLGGARHLAAANQTSSLRSLNSLAGHRLEFETKWLPTRQLLLVNSIPLLECDLMASNGVVHMLARPILERHLAAEACQCAVGEHQQQQQQQGGAQSQPVASLTPSNDQLEREESRPPAHRAQRFSGSLIEHNNRDFYRPTTTVVALEREEPQQPQVNVSSIIRGQPFIGSHQERARLLAAAANNQQRMASTTGDWGDIYRPANQTELFDFIEKYKIVMNATTRQKLRTEQQQQQPQQQAAADLLRSSSSNLTSSQFVYDRSPPVAPSTVAAATNWLAQPTTRNSTFAQSASGRILRFQPEDARDPIVPLAGERVSSRQQQQQQQQPEYDVFSGGQKQPQSVGSLLSSCAFYDTNCRRLTSTGNLVRLSPKAAAQASKSRQPQPQPQQQQQQQQQQLQLVQPPASSTSAPLRPQIYSQTPPAGAAVHLDSTFGEVTENPFLAALRASSHTSATASLPVWSNTANQTRTSGGGSSSSTSAMWPATSHQDDDLVRLSSNRSGANLHLLRPTSASSAQILLVPVKMFQDTNRLLSLAHLQQMNEANRLAAAAPSSDESKRPPIYFGQPATSSNDRLKQSIEPINWVQQQHQEKKNRLFASNFSAFDEQFDSSLQQSNKNQHSVTFNDEPAPAKSPSAIVMRNQKQLQQQQQQQQIDAEGIKRARQQFRLQSPWSSKEPASGGGGASDISVTSAKLAANSKQPQSGALSALASSPAASSPSAVSAADFFQNRTIAEIMADSGLRIDGQQVTFNKLAECLGRANLLDLLVEPNGALTIFMPTDLAFERLLQQQLASSRLAGSGSGGAAADDRQLSARLADARRHQQLPLLVRARPASANLVAADAESSDKQLLGRLALDCASQQVRQLLLDHLSAQLVTPRQLQADLALTSLSGRKLLISNVPSKRIVVVDGQPVIAATRAKNGMVYVVNRFLNITQQPANVVELMRRQPNLTTFMSYLNFSSLADRLKRETGPITILAPTNEAFEQLSSAARQLINSDPSALADILRGHVVEGAQFGKLISMRNSLKTINADQTIDARVIRPNFYQLDHQLTSMRLVGTSANGVVNAIDRLIVPPWLRVSMSQPTAPSNSIDSPREFEELRLLPSGRSISAAASSSSANTSNNLPNLNTKPVNFDSTSSLSGPNLVSSFSFARDQKELPPSSTLSPVVAASGFEFLATTVAPSAGGQTKNLRLIEKLGQLMRASKFVDYIKRSRLSDRLKADMNYVLLVPTDQAIQRLPEQIIDTLERDADKLSDLVDFHVLDTTFEFINLIPDGQTLETINEKSILFNWHKNNSILTASGAIVLGGVQEENVALLLVDRVLYPTPGNLWQIIVKSPILSNFTRVVQAAGLEPQLSTLASGSSSSGYSLFAPSDGAFAASSGATLQLESLLRDRQKARNFVLRHLSQPAIFTSSIALASGASLSSTNSLGSELTLRQKNDYFSVNDVNFSYADVAATNGVVHVIDGLLLAS